MNLAQENRIAIATADINDSARRIRTLEEIEPVTLPTLASMQICERVFVIPGLLTGTVGALVGESGVGKTFLALEIGMAVACGPDLLRIRMPNHGTGKVVYFGKEDPIPELQQRIKSLEAVEGRLPSNFEVFSLFGINVNLMREDHLRVLSSRSRGARLVIFDTLSKFHNADENDNSQMAQVLGRFDQIANDTGAAVLFVHHVGHHQNRTGGPIKKRIGRGASAITDNSRWTAFLENANGGKIRFGLSKANYSTKANDLFFQKSETGVLLPANNLSLSPQRSVFTKNSKKTSFAATAKNYEGGNWYAKSK